MFGFARPAGPNHWPKEDSIVNITLRVTNIFAIDCEKSYLWRVFGEKREIITMKIPSFTSIGRIIILLLAGIILCSASYAQSGITGRLSSKSDQGPIAGGYVLVAKEGRIVNSSVSDKEGKYSLDNLSDGKYMLEVTCMGYKTIQDSLVLGGPCRRDYQLEEEAIEVGEVAVVADRSQTVTRTANGQRFYLSADAKKKGNPFQALQEIPVLISDANTSSIKMADGSSPLILINGNVVNSGVNPLSPSDIESVEVINSVSARYLQEGVTSIVNITLKKTAKPYLWLEAATRHDIPLNNGFGVGYFEVGNRKFSLYGRAAYHYTYHDDVESTVDRANTTYSQHYRQTTRDDAGSWLGELLFKWQATDKDYFAAQVYGTTKETETRQNALGNYTSDAEQVYKFNASSTDDSKILTSGLYYKHTFAPENDLEVRLSYNFNRNDYSEWRTDAYDEHTDETASLYKNKGHSGSLNIDYSKTFASKSSMILGSRSTLVMDEIDNRAGAHPLFKHRNCNYYIYAGYGGAYGNKLYYNVSVGVEGIWAKAGNADYSYIRPRGSASMTWAINGHNSIQLTYSLTNTAPAVACLNPYNTSTDALVVAVGNPDLKPEMMNRISAGYTLNAGNLYITPEACYKHVGDMIEAYGYTKEGVYYSTYANSGRFSQVSAGAHVSYRFKWGRIYGGGGWYADHYEDQDAKNSAYASLGFNAQAKKFSFYGTFEYSSRDYTTVSFTKYYQPSFTNLQVNYNFNPNFYIGVCLQYVTGEFRTKTVTNDGSFRSVTENRYTDKCLRPWVILRYTFRKNSDRRHKLEKVLDSNEQGITIKRQ